jgi:hypothetical protein
LQRFYRLFGANRGKALSQSLRSCKPFSMLYHGFFYLL